MIEPKSNSDTRFKSLLNGVLTDFVEQYVPSSLRKAALHYLIPGGKRIRALLLCRIISTVGQLDLESERLTAAGASLELLHAASLIHDDLPCLDNDDLRRGEPTLHKIVPEGEALLIGNVLYSLGSLAAARVASGNIHLNQVVSETVLNLNLGQVFDLRGIQSARLKTGQLFGLAVYFAATLLDKSPSEYGQWFECGELLGILFQCRDDLIDGDAQDGSLEFETLHRLKRLETMVDVPILQIWDALLAEFDESSRDQYKIG